MPEINHNNTHSEEAQEILGRIPSWIVRRGVTVIFAVFVAIVIGCCLVRFPERINATVTVTTGNAPVDVIARAGGNIERILVSNGDSVTQGTLLGAVSTGADFRDVQRVENLLNELSYRSLDSAVFDSRIRVGYRLGSLQGEWIAFATACRKYADYISRDVIGHRKRRLQTQMDKQKEYYGQLQRQLEAIRKDLEYEKQAFRRDSSLHTRKVISAMEYEEASRRLLQALNAVMSFESQMISGELSVIQSAQQIEELSIQQEDEMLTMEQDVRNCTERMSAQIDSWKLDYLFTAPISGKVSFVRKWEEGQTIGSGEAFLTVVPGNNQNVIGIVRIPQASFGKVQVGQKVNVRLNGYPYMEYGVLTGEISYLSSVPEKGSDTRTEPCYIAEIKFPSGLRTGYGRELRLIQQMDGTAEIITKDRRLISRFIDPIITLFDNGI